MKKTTVVILFLFLTFSGCSVQNKQVNALPESATEQIAVSAYGYMFLTADGDVYTYGKTQDFGQGAGIYFLGVKIDYYFG